ncbi:MAG: hypothetical protein HN413_06075 [Chloroflexi bacterium]|jgi:pyroglutamyl-peptidase|nr:hypothetical protein [Chloroflexota bacterium]
MKKVLITGFGPFQHIAVNPALLLIEALGKSNNLPANMDLRRAILPVVYGQAGEQIQTLIREIQPDVLISFGVASSKAQINLERVAINVQDAPYPDNAGILKQGDPIHPTGAGAYFSNLPLLELKSIIEAAGSPAVISNHAGAYICNEVFYAAAREIQALGLPTRFGFIHLPEIAETAQGETKNDFTLSKLVQAAEAMLVWLTAFHTHMSQDSTLFAPM